MSFLNKQDPASPIEWQEVVLADRRVITLQWLETGELRISIWHSVGGMKKLASSTVLASDEATNFLATLNARQPTPE